MALYEEAISARKVGKPEYTTRCESIASEIFPVEQQVLSSVSQFRNSCWDGEVSYSSNFFLATPEHQSFCISKLELEP